MGGWAQYGSLLPHIVCHWYITPPSRRWSGLTTRTELCDSTVATLHRLLTTPATAEPVPALSSEQSLYFISRASIS